MANSAPIFDGETKLYEPDESGVAGLLDLKQLTDFALEDALVNLQIASEISTKKIVYINGIRTTPDAHMSAAVLLATLAGREVYGIYNMTGLTGHDSFLDKITDAADCLLDWTNPIGRMRSVFGTSPGVDDLVAQYTTPEARAEKAKSRLKRALQSSKPAVSLFDFLYDNGDDGVIVVAHSRGNLITANVCWSLLWAKSFNMSNSIGDVEVLGLASPNPSWPPNGQRGFRFDLFRDPRDPVTLLSIPKAGQAPAEVHGDIPKLGLTFEAHDVKLYLLGIEFIRGLKVALQR